MRAIDADAMIDRLKEWDTKDKTDKALYNFTLNRINEQLTIQPAQPERIKGLWIEYDDGITACECSVCHEKYNLYEEDVFGRNFCPNCGADMRGEQNEP